MGGKEISESAEKDRHKRRVKGLWVFVGDRKPNFPHRYLQTIETEIRRD